jgi:SOS-response transcriptional repressor LexA
MPAASGEGMKDLLAPRTSSLTRYRVPSGGILTIRVTARSPLDVYMMDSDQLSRYEQDGMHGLLPLAASIGHCEHVVSTFQRPGDSVWLVVENKSREGSVLYEYSAEIVGATIPV